MFAIFRIFGSLYKMFSFFSNIILLVIIAYRFEILQEDIIKEVENAIGTIFDLVSGVFNYIFAILEDLLLFYNGRIKKGVILI